MGERGCKGERGPKPEGKRGMQRARVGQSSVLWNILAGNAAKVAGFGWVPETALPKFERTSVARSA